MHNKQLLPTGYDFDNPNTRTVVSPVGPDMQCVEMIVGSTFESVRAKIIADHFPSPVEVLRHPEYINTFRP